MKVMQIVILAAVAVAALPAALAHTDTPHAKKGAPVVKEQKPWGIAGDAKQAGVRTVRISMSDAMRFTPDTLRVREGETLRLVIKNEGKLLHEYVLGTKTELDAHAALMVKFPTMEHSEPYMVHVKPGDTGEIVWTFNRSGNFDFACLIAGHYQAGMVGKVVVEPANRS